jgi:hypothetical protein
MNDRVGGHMVEVIVAGGQNEGGDLLFIFRII